MVLLFISTFFVSVRLNICRKGTMSNKCFYSVIFTHNCPLLVLLRLVISCGWHFEFSDRFAVLRRRLLLIASTRGEGLVKIWKWFADLKTIHWTIQILTEWKRHRETAMGKWKEVRAVQKVPYTRILTPRDTTLFGRKGLVDKTLFNTRFYSLFVFSAIFLI